MMEGETKFHLSEPDLRTVESLAQFHYITRQVDRGYYWSAPSVYPGNQITRLSRFAANYLTAAFAHASQFSLAPGTSIQFEGTHLPLHLLSVESSTILVLYEPDIVLEGSQSRMPNYDSDDAEDEHERIGRPATISDLITVLSHVDRLLIKAKYINDQTMVEWR
ncbi:hypothetical protein FGIG_00888 [Fasciola gigantica]|uniref:Laminin IV type A domain-containing protein n=1 Tax=Fasciola gigantica TaxID=46835 RepID=A0A504Y915_FASGI|nr:hypothetical protein FGIG_00888 [Fasciola gigantica]